MNDDGMSMEYQIAFELIAVAGDSKGESMMAIEAASKFQFEEAQEHLKAADERMAQAHHIQTDMLQREASGQKTDVNIILVHAQDHLTAAIIMRDQAEIMINLYRTIEKLSGK